MKHFVYILQSLKDGKYYIGYTTDLDKRICYHNSGKQRSTKSRIPFRIVYSEEFATRQLALKREKKIKSYKGGNEFKRLITGSQ